MWCLPEVAVGQATTPASSAPATASAPARAPEQNPIQKPKYKKPVLQIRSQQPSPSSAPVPSAPVPSAPVPSAQIPMVPVAPKPFVPDLKATSTLPKGLPMRVEIEHRYRMKVGKIIQGRLIDPVYVSDHVLLPAGTLVDGRIAKLTPIGRSDRTWALLNGDFTPLKKPEIAFDSIQLPGDKHESISAYATERTTGVVKMSAKPKKKPSIWQRAKAPFRAVKNQAEKMIHSHHKKEGAEKFLYAQLAYHPQDIWSGTQFDAVLTAPATLPDPRIKAPLPVNPARGSIPPGTIEARLTTPLSSVKSKVGDPVEAVLTEPFLNAARTEVVLPTGTRLVGTVLQSKRARVWGRNGTLRFSFHQVQLPTGTMAGVQSQMTGVEGAKGQNLSVDSEGGAHANSGAGKVLAPLALSLLAGHSFDADQSFASAGAASNGFGLIANLTGLLADSPPVSEGFAFYALGKSLTRRWIMRGHEVVFPQNTRMEMNIAAK